MKKYVKMKGKEVDYFYLKQSIGCVVYAYFTDGTRARITWFPNFWIAQYVVIHWTEGSDTTVI